MSKVEVKLMAGEVVPRLNGLKKLVEKDLPIKAAYRLSRIIKAYQDEAKTYEESRLKLINKYCKKDKEGSPVTKDGVYHFDPKGRAAFDKEMQNLFATAITIEAAPLSLGELEGTEVSASDLLLLGDFLKED